MRKLFSETEGVSERIGHGSRRGGIAGGRGGFARFDRVESIPERVVPLPPPPPGRSERFASALVVEEVVVGPFGNGKWRRGGAMSD